MRRNSLTAIKSSKVLVTSVLAATVGLQGTWALAAESQSGTKPAANASSQPSSPFESGKVQLDMESMAKDHPELAGSNPGIGVASVESRAMAALPKGSRLTMLLKNDCVRSQAGGTLSKQAAKSDSPNPSLKVQAYSTVTAQDMTKEQLSKLADSDKCIVGISNESNVSLDPHEEDEPGQIPPAPGEPVAGTMTAPNDPLFGTEKYMAAIKAPEAYDTFYDPAKGVRAPVVVAVIDTGVNYNHPDLAGNMWTNAQGYHGYDFGSRDNYPMDAAGHGTHVAGLVAGIRDNGIGVSGVMGSGAKVMSVKVLGGPYGGTSTTIANGIMYAVQNGANVISMSFGGMGKSATYQYAIDQAIKAGVTVVASAGNSGDSLTDNTWHSPSSYARDMSGFISVGAFDSVSFTKPWFSNFSTQGYVEIGSPGANGIISTLINGGYGPKMGTSMAAPIVSGAAALTIGLLKSRGYDAPPALVEQLIRESADSQPALMSYFTDGKTLDLKNLAQIINDRYPAK